MHSSLVVSVLQTREQAVGVTLHDARLDKDNARQQIVSKFIDTNAEINPQIRVIVGSDRTNVGDPERFTFNADVSADLQSPVLLSVSSMGRTPDEIRETIDACREVVANAGTQVIGVFITDCTNSALPTLTDEFVSYDLPTWPLPLVELGSADTNVKAALDAFDEHVDKESLLNVLDTPFVPPTTPFAFQYDLLARAKKDKKTIVLPEGEDDRIITAANYLLQSNVVDLVIIGDRNEILARGEKLGLKALDQAKFVSIDDKHLLDTMVPKLCELRAKKGMTPDVALKTLRDTNYFGTMLIVLGMADGLVSGAISSTANTVRPALQLIKTKPGVSSVSGAFLMCLKGSLCRYLPIVPSTSIPIRSSWPTSPSSRPRPPRHSPSIPKSVCSPTPPWVPVRDKDVDLVVEATSIAQNKRPDLPIVGPHPVRCRLVEDGCQGQGLRQPDCRQCHRVRVPGPRCGEHLLQGSAAHLRRRGDRSRCFRGSTGLSTT